MFRALELNEDVIRDRMRRPGEGVEYVEGEWSEEPEGMPLGTEIYPDRLFALREPLYGANTPSISCFPAPTANSRAHPGTGVPDRMGGEDVVDRRYLVSSLVRRCVKKDARL